MTLRTAILCSLLTAATIAVAWSEEPLQFPPDRPIEEVVDAYVSQWLKEIDQSPAPIASDTTLLRRTTLDLVGRIPTVQEAKAYRLDPSPGKRARLVERLLQSPGYTQHQSHELDSLLNPNNSAPLRKYLEEAAAENLSWERIFRDFMTPQANQPQPAPAEQFIKTRIGDIDKLTNDTSVLFFGVNISCAKCHDHPLVEQWQQSHFYGMKSFFSRTFANGDFLAERDYGAVQFKTTAGETKTASMMFLSGHIVDEPGWQEPSDEDKKKKQKELETLKKNKQPVPAPEFSRRSKLVEVALSEPERDFFARNIVNRIWYRVFGHGLVMPLDQLHEGNPASHPELLAWLADDMIAHQYDLKRLLRGLVLSQAYARQSHSHVQPRPDPAWFAVAQARPLTRYQYGHSLQVASMNPDHLAVADAKQVADRLHRIYGENGLAHQLDQPIHHFQVSSREALLFSNSDQVQKNLLADRPESLVGKLKALENHAQQVEWAYWTILSRPPETKEQELLTTYLQARKDRPVAAIQQLIWILLTSTEFRFNH